MTVPAFAEEIGGLSPSADEKKTANQLRRIIASRAANGAKLRLHDDAKSVEIALTPHLSKLLIDLLRHVGRGDAVTLVPVGQTLTTQEAADILNVSRPHLISLLDRGEIEYDFVGRHRRIQAQAVFTYKRLRDEKRAQALSNLAASDADLL